MKKKIGGGCGIFLIFLLTAVFLVFAQEETSSPSPGEYSEEYYPTEIYFTTPSGDWDLNKINWQDSGLYASDYFDQNFLETLPVEYYSSIDAGKVIAAGKGKLLNADQIRENLDEVTDLRELDSGHLNTFLQAQYAIQELNVKNCRPGDCVIKGGVLRNGKKDSLTLKTIENLKAKITASKKGEIFVIIDEPGGEEGSIGAKRTLDEPLEPLPDDNFNLVVDQKVSREGIWVKSGEREYNLLFGKFHLKGTGVEVKPAEKKEDYVIIDDIKIQVFQPEPLKIIRREPTNIFSKELYLGEEKLIAVGSDYRLIFLSNNKYLNIDFQQEIPPVSVIEPVEGGFIGKHFFGFQLEGNKEENIPSKLTLTKKTEGGRILPPEVSITGRTKMQNGNKLIQTDGNHFVSIPREAENLGIPRKNYPLTDMTIKFEQQPDNSLLIEKDRILIGGQKTTYLSAEYTKEGRIDISLQLGEWEKGKVKKPALFIYTPLSQTFDPTTKENLELEVWEQGKNIVQLNKGEEVIPITIYLGDEYSPQTEMHRQNELYLLDFLSAAKEKDLPVAFLGHSAVDYDEGTFYVLAQDAPPPYELTEAQLSNPEFVREYLKKDSRGARVPLDFFAGRNINNPLFCSCSSASLFHGDTAPLEGISGIEELPGPQGEVRVLSGKESLALLTYTTMKTKRGKDYRWPDFRQDWDQGKVHFPSCAVFRQVQTGLKDLQLGMGDWSGHPQDVCY